MPQSWNSDDYLLQSSLPPSREDSMPNQTSRLKRVDWQLPNPSPEEEYATKPEPSRSISDEELRMGVHKILGNVANSPNSMPLPRLPKSVMRSGTSTPLSTVGTPPEIEDEIEDFQSKSLSAAIAQDRASRLSKSLGKSDGHLFRSSKGKEKGHFSPKKRSHADLYHEGSGHRSGVTTPDQLDFNDDFIPRPLKYRVSGFSAMQLLTNITKSRPHSRASSIDEESEVSGTITPEYSPKKAGFFERSPRDSMTSLSHLLHSTNQLGSVAVPSVGKSLEHQTPSIRPGMTRFHSDGSINTVHNHAHSNSFLDLTKYLKKSSHGGPHAEEAQRIKKHVQETHHRHRYLLKLCRALMEYGAPTHRLEEYMKMSARVLETEAQFLYLPGCMIVSFDDSRSHTTEVRLVRVLQTVDLGKLRDTHEIYKEVVHDLIGVEEASERLGEITARADKFKMWQLIIAHGVASASVGPFAFGARYIDLGPAFVLGCILGFLRLKVAASSDLYANVFEVFSTVITSFLSRWLGSLRGGELFCFSALAQSSIALILPGYVVLLGALELQSRSIIAGSVRIVYAIVFSFFIGFGMTIGTAIYGVIDKSANSDSTCRTTLPKYQPFIFVPIFALCLMVINQAKFKQMPVMLLIAFAGYIVSFFSSHRFVNYPPISSTLAALMVSVLANTYSRIGLKLDKPFWQMCEWIWTIGGLQKRKQTPTEDLNNHEKEIEMNQIGNVMSGPKSWLRSLLPSRATTYAKPDVEANGPSNVATDIPIRRDSDAISEASTVTPEREHVRVNYSLAAAAMLPAIFVLVPSGLSVSGSLIQGISSADSIVKSSNSTTSISSSSSGSAYDNNISFIVGTHVLEVAVGITVGLFIGSLVVYPFGKGGKWGGGKKMRSGLFSF